MESNHIEFDSMIVIFNNVYSLLEKDYRFNRKISITFYMYKIPVNPTLAKNTLEICLFNHKLEIFIHYL